MRNDPESTKQIEPHDIVQVVPTDDNRGQGNLGRHRRDELAAVPVVDDRADRRACGV